MTFLRGNPFPAQQPRQLLPPAHALQGIPHLPPPPLQVSLQASPSPCPFSEGRFSLPLTRDKHPDHSCRSPACAPWPLAIAASLVSCAPWQGQKHSTSCLWGAAQSYRSSYRTRVTSLDFFFTLGSTYRRLLCSQRWDSSCVPSGVSLLPV